MVERKIASCLLTRGYFFCFVGWHGNEETRWGEGAARVQWLVAFQGAGPENNAFIKVVDAAGKVGLDSGQGCCRSVTCAAV